jgi:RNA polymerase primary sigma factor
LDDDQFIDDPLKVYLAEVAKVPPLTSSEEIRCVELIRAGGEEMESAERRLVEANLHLVVAIAERYPHDDIHILDLIQNGNEGLLKAVGTISKRSQDNFPAYATPFIEGAIEGFIASPHRIPPVPVHRRLT